jgi:hypothetical protein
VAAVQGSCRSLRWRLAVRKDVYRQSLCSYMRCNMFVLLAAASNQRRVCGLAVTAVCWQNLHKDAYKFSVRCTWREPQRTKYPFLYAVLYAASGDLVSW